MAQFPTGQCCAECGGEFSMADMRVNHTDACSNNPANRPADAPTASNVASFALARADRGTKPREHKPADALDLAREWLESCGEENQAQHIIVFLGRTNGDNSSGTKYFQTGTFSCHGQVGLVIEGLDMLRNSG